MTWDVRLLKAWTAGWYREAEHSRLASEARRAGGAARRRRWWRRWS